MQKEKGKSFLLSLVMAGTAMVMAPSALAATTIGNDVSVGGTLGVTGASTLAQATSTIVTTSLYLSVGGTPVSYNASYAAGSLNAKNLSLDGTAAVSSTLIVGGVATFRGNILADANAVTNIGAYGSAFNNVYSSGTVFGAALNLTGAVTVNGAATLTSVTSTIVTTSLYLSVGGTPVSYNASYAAGSLNAKNLSLDGTAAVSSTLIVGGAATFRGNILADANNTADLGGWGQAFRNAYVSSSLTIGGGSGVSSTAITAHMSKVSTFDIPSAASSTFKCASSTVSLTGSRQGDTVVVTPSFSDPAFSQGQLTGLIMVNDNVEVIYCSGGGYGDSDPDNGAYRIDVWKH